MSLLLNHEHSGTASPPRRLTRHLPWLVVLGVLAVVIAAVWYSQLQPQLTAVEAKLVGTWTFPMPPNPPANAVQQIFEMRPDHTLITYGKPIATGVKTAGGRGGWRLEDGNLVWETQRADFLKRSLAWWEGHPTVLVSRSRFLSCDGETLLIQATGGSAAKMIRLPGDRK